VNSGYTKGKYEAPLPSHGQTRPPEKGIRNKYKRPKYKIQNHFNSALSIWCLNFDFFWLQHRQFAIFGFTELNFLIDY